MSAKHKDEEAIFYAALELRSAAERRAYLKGVCGDDLDLLARVEALLKVQASERSIVEAAAASLDMTLETEPLTEGPGTRIGRYKLLQLIGEGGFGVVYMAEQREPIRRRVALKIIKLGMDTKQVIARFEAERQALAMMEHPNIAKVLEAGATDTGRPYFVMELVKGISITEYCDKNNLDTRQRLELFIEVCRAVQHAHQKGIIHRDIKPTNVLVTLRDDDTPVPKIIDFGIAKATQARLTEKTLFTEFKQFIGTPEYMSPEQARMGELDIDTRSDIYALGVLLYELLTGTTPFDREKLRSSAYDEMLKTIRETEPPKPSTRLNTLGDVLTEVAKHRHAEPSELCKIITGDLDWIVLKTLEKERTRRYETANELVADIQRHLGDEPVIAGPPSTTYRVGKFVRRNRALVTAIAAVLVVLVVGIVVSTIFAIGQSRARARAEQAREKEAIARAEAVAARDEARQAEKIAQQQRQVAEEQAEARRRALYFNQIALAAAAYHDDNMPRVRELLGLCPEDLRGWEWYRLWHISDLSLMTLRGYSERVRSVAFRPDGKRIVSGSTDRTVKVWDSATGSELITLQGHEDRLRSVVFSPDGKRIVSGGGALKIWDAETGSQVMTLEDHTGDVVSAVFRPDGKQIVSGSEDGTVKVWDAETGSEVMALRGDEELLHCVGFSPDGKRIVSGGGALKIWDAATGTELMTLRGHGSPVNSVMFSPDGKFIVSGSDDRTVKIWDAETGSEVMTLRGHSDDIPCVQFSPDGKHIVSGSDDMTIRIWDAATGTELMTLRGHGSRVNSVMFSPDGKLIVSGSADETIKLWDAAVDRERIVIRGHNREDCADCGAWALAFSPDGRRIVSGSVDYTLRMWDVERGTEVMTLRGYENGVGSTGGPQERIWRSLAFSPDGKRIVSGSKDNMLTIWDVDSGAEVMTLQGHESNVRCVVFSPDAKLIVSGSEDNTLKVWDTDSGSEMMTLREHSAGVFSVSFSPDGKQIVSGSEDGMIKIWDTATGAAVMTLDGHDSMVTSIVFSPEGKCFVSGGKDGMIRLWDTTTGAEVMTLPLQKDGVWCVAFSPDGKQIISSTWNGDEGTVRLWDAGTGAEVITLQWKERVVLSVAFSPDGKTVALGNGIGTITLLKSAVPPDVYGQRRSTEAGDFDSAVKWQEQQKLREELRNLSAGKKATITSGEKVVPEKIDNSNE
ncbi:MAG: WD40 domain-containing protein [Planctomycetota bacterium]|jgi:WD40 repeat protein/predicted Ser/Thr protein kinase